MQREKGVRSMDDTQIVALYWARDEAALAESEQKYGGYCRAIALGILESREDAAEPDILLRRLPKWAVRAGVLGVGAASGIKTCRRPVPPASFLISSPRASRPPR